MTLPFPLRSYDLVLLTGFAMMLGCADGWPRALRGPSQSGTLVLEWKQPVTDLVMVYGTGDPDRGGSSHRFQRSFRMAHDRRPVTLQLPLATGRNDTWYGFFDPERRAKVYEIQHRYVECRPGGRLRVELDAKKEFHHADEELLRAGECDESSWYVSIDETLWQEGCSVPDYALGLTPPAVATVSARWTNPTAGNHLWVYTDTRRKSLIHELRSSSHAIPMRSGPGKVWVDFSDRTKQVWLVQSQAFTCANGGQLNVQVNAAVVEDVPTVKLETTGQGCHVTGPPVVRCTSGKRHPAQHRSEDGCWPEQWESDCCLSAPGDPCED
jgi:hypothetical protein